MKKLDRNYKSSAEVDELTMDVREAEAAGKSYGRWRASQRLAAQESRKQPKAKKKKPNEKKNQREKS